MGARGPVPKRSRERRRQNKDSVAETITVDAAKPVQIPKPNARWHPIAKRWFLSLAGSGQAVFYEPSDWALAEYIAEAMSRNLREQKRFSAVLFAAVMSGMTELLTSEGARRRVRLEIERGDGSEAPANVTAIAKYQKRLRARGNG